MEYDGPPKPAGDDFPWVDDLEIAVVQSGSITFHLQSRSGDWQHGPDAALDLTNLEQALLYSGVHDILTCACGLAGCHCQGSRSRGVETIFLSYGDCLWHDRDRDVGFRFSRHRLLGELERLKAWFRALTQEIPTREMGDPNEFIRPYRSGVCLGTTVPTPFEMDLVSSWEEWDSRHPQPPEPECSESATAALRLFPELPNNNDIAAEIRAFTKWIDDDRLWPLGSKFVPFIESLIRVLPSVSTLPLRERVLLVLAAAAPHFEQPDPTLRGYSKLRSILGSLDTVWQSLLSVRLPTPYDPMAVPHSPDARLPLIGALLRLSELLDVDWHRARSPIPRNLFEPTEVLVESDDPTLPDYFEETPFDRDGLMEFWKRAYTSEVARLEDGTMSLTFTLPTERSEAYEARLVVPRVQEVEGLLDFVRSELKTDAITVGPLRVKIQCSEGIPRMTAEDETLFGMVGS